FGLNKDREGIITRYLKEKNNWTPHLNNSKKYILNSAKNKKKETAVILGSGWWLDLPYIELSKMFKKLYFVDISHPNQIKHKAKQFTNIELVTADISGTFKSIYELKKKRSSNIINDLNIDVNNFGLPKNIKADFVVSLNLINQLSYFPKAFLLKHELISENEVNDIVKKIEDTHIANLPKNKSCIIADFYQYEYDFKDVLKKESIRTLAELPKNNSRKEWIWDFDLSGNFINNRKVKFNVAALQV
ncbi:MAG: hypothetical protein GXO49_06160, partial [Chlorobi bacterium]|nr:hypothetical protein [Chlorobiota bacterium]